MSDVLFQKAIEVEIKNLIKEIEAFHKEHKPYENCNSITKREIALFVLYKQGRIRFSI
jgi:hypothetical protein